MGNTLSLKLTIAGTFGELSLTEQTFVYSVPGQNAASGPDGVTVLPGDPLGSIDFPLTSLATQAAFLVVSDQRVFYRLNGESLDRVIEADGFVVLSGDPVITSLRLGGNGVNVASVNVIQLGKAGTPPAPPILDILPDQVTPAERAAGTELGLRSFSPEDIAVMAFLHGGASAATFEVVRPFVAGVLVRDTVYQTAGGSVDRASAASLATAETFLGFVVALDDPGVGLARVQFGNDLSGFSGLATGGTYILASSPGKIVDVSDTGNPIYPNPTPGSGHVVREVGHAASATALFVETSRDFELN